MTTAAEGAPLPRHARFGRLGRVCRLGLATRGDTRLDAGDVLAAIDRGVDFLNWCGQPDGLSAAVRRFGERRREVLIAVQLEARDARGACRELAGLLGELGTPWIDLATHYYLESDEEWAEIMAPGGAREALEEARAAGTVRAVGITSHQRPLAARIARSGAVDTVMVRYNAAHRGAEDEVFPAALERGLPVVAYTALRWGALLGPTPDDPPGFTPPRAREWYRFVLCHPVVTVAIAAPDGRAELEEDLALLDDWRGLTPEERRVLCEHGDRVHRHAGEFP
jgi:aryl-alcohol dehydrogenase-like predicted oxidoreductase